MSGYISEGVGKCREEFIIRRLVFDKRKRLAEAFVTGFLPKWSLGEDLSNTYRRLSQL